MWREPVARPVDDYPCEVVAFPSNRRVGHARRVADQLARARSHREGDWVLHRALWTHHDQMVRAGIPSGDLDREVERFRVIIHNQCLYRTSRWIPTLPERDEDLTGASAE